MPSAGCLLALAALPALVWAQLAQPCYMQYNESHVLNKSLDFENPMVFELLASNYSRQRSAFFELLHRERDCVTLSYWINNAPDSVNFHAKLRFACGLQELFRMDLSHAPHRLARDGYCLAMRHADRPLEQCAFLGMSRSVPITLQADIRAMVILSQQSPHRFDYLLFQRVQRHKDMLQTLEYFEARYGIAQGTLERRGFYTSRHWLKCDCERIWRSLAPLHQCLGIRRTRPGTQGELSIVNPTDTLLTTVAVGIGCGVGCFLLIKIRLLC